MTGLKLALQLVALIALMLCAIGAAYFSISGMAVLVPGDPVLAMVLGIQLETAKIVIARFVATAWFSHRWNETICWRCCLFMGAYAVGAASISAVSLYSHLVVANIDYPSLAGGERVTLWLIAVTGACCGPLAVVLAAAFAAATRRAA
jgi:hypothetical protein